MLAHLRLAPSLALVTALAAFAPSGARTTPAPPAAPMNGAHGFIQAHADNDELARLPGALLLAAPGELAPAARSAFVDLAGGGAATIVTLSPSKDDARAIDWRDEGAHASVWFRTRNAVDLEDPNLLEGLLAADGVWLGALDERTLTSPLLRALLVAAMERGAVVGAAAEQAVALTGVPGVDDDRLCLAPRLHLVFGSQDPGNEDTHHEVGRATPARVVAAMPDGTAIAFHGGRWGDLLGSGAIGFAVYRANGEMVEEHVLPCRDARDLGDPLDDPFDLLAWIRQAREAEGASEWWRDRAESRVAKGALIVQGGGGVSEATWQRFIEIAGGPTANIVSIPSANTMEDDAAPRSYSAHELEQLGCTSVRIVHVAERRRANHDRHLIAAIDAADAVWIDGGRTFRFMDRFGETAAADALARVLERGGVVGGSSAGCQVVGDLLVRGDPKSNSEMLYPGYTRGLGLIEGVVFDAHFRERGRHGQLRGVVQDHPTMLGIGVDAGTALLIRGTTAEVLGENGVNVYDARRGGELPERGVAYESGASFELTAPIEDAR